VKQRSETEGFIFFIFFLGEGVGRWYFIYIQLPVRAVCGYSGEVCNNEGDM
jgi:hypothetical protein